MKKKISSLILVMALLLALPVTASAETLQGDDNWKVTFDGKSMNSNFESNKMDEVVYSMEPGDEVILKVKLQNDHSKSTEWYMSNEIVKSMEDSKASASGGAYEYRLSYTGKDGNENVIYDSSAVGGEDTKNGEGLHKVSEALGEMFHLDSLAAGGGSGTVQLVVKLDGETQGNGYQESLAELKMKFAAEESATVKEVTKTKKKVKTKKVTKKVPSKRAKTVKTGDDANILLYVSLAAFALGLILLLLVFRRYREEEPQETVKTGARRGRREDR